MFLVINGSIVVGDKTAHVAVIHIPQLFYFSLFCIFFAWPHFVKFLVPFKKDVLRNMILSAFLLNLIIIVVQFNTLEHPYLLADNRHYTFYIWTRFYVQITAFRYIVTVLYSFGLYCVIRSICYEHEICFVIMYVFCTTIVLVLQKMIEVRYFFVPFVILRLRIRNPPKIIIFLELTSYTIINFVTLKIFFEKDIYWDDFDYVQKLIW